MHHARTNPAVIDLNAMNDDWLTACPEHQIIFRAQRSCEGAALRARTLVLISKHNRGLVRKEFYCLGSRNIITDELGDADACGGMIEDQAKHEKSFEVGCKETDRFRDCTAFTVSLVRNPVNVAID